MIGHIARRLLAHRRTIAAYGCFLALVVGMAFAAPALGNGAGEVGKWLAPAAAPADVSAPAAAPAELGPEQLRGTAGYAYIAAKCNGQADDLVCGVPTYRGAVAQLDAEQAHERLEWWTVEISYGERTRTVSFVLYISPKGRVVQAD